MKNLILFSIGIVLGAVIVYLWHVQQTPTIELVATGPVQYNCELSDGTFENNACICPIEEGLGQTQETMYDDTTGYCQTTFGGPGGEAGEVLPNGFEYFYNIITYNCEQSGGRVFTYGRCSCPDGTDYDTSNGYCVAQ